MFIIIFIIFLALLSLTNVKLTIIFHRIYEDDYIQLNLLLLFGLIKLKFKIPYLDVIFNKFSQASVKSRKKLDFGKDKDISKTNGIVGVEKIKYIYNKFKNSLKMYENAIEYILSKIKLDYIKWHTEIGFNDAALTGIISGLIWGIKGSILGILSSKISSDSINIKVNPNYSMGIFEVDLCCIIRIKIANIIIAGLKIAYAFLLNGVFRKGGEINERSSYTRFNENYNG